jgi:hypothetical protein
MIEPMREFAMDHLHGVAYAAPPFVPFFGLPFGVFPATAVLPFTLADRWGSSRLEGVLSFVTSSCQADSEPRCGNFGELQSHLRGLQSDLRGLQRDLAACEQPLDSLPEAKAAHERNPNPHSNPPKQESNCILTAHLHFAGLMMKIKMKNQEEESWCPSGAGAARAFYPARKDVQSTPPFPSDTPVVHAVSVRKLIHTIPAVVRRRVRRRASVRRPRVARK